MQKNDGKHLGLGLCPKCGGNNQVSHFRPVHEGSPEEKLGFKDSYSIYCTHCHFGTPWFDDAEGPREFWKTHFGRKDLADGREHLTEDGQFQSDKYEWCQPGYLPLSLKDPMARDLIEQYAKRRSSVDEEFARDILEALENGK
jgi:hypothetical protein